MKRAQHRAYGYLQCPDRVKDCIQQWAEKSFGWKIEKDWITIMNGVCLSLCLFICLHFHHNLGISVALCINTFSHPGDGIVVLSPIYYPLTNLSEDNGRVVHRSSLKFNPETHRYEIDWDDFEAKLALPRTKIYINCSPHNPSGRLWTREELLRIGQLCLKHHVLIVSDEIHWDFALPIKDKDGKEPRHIPIASVSPEIADITRMLFSPVYLFH